MAFSTYTELKALVATYLKRTDQTTNIIDWVALCEAQMQRLLKTSSMEASTTLTATAGSPLVTLPTGFVSVRRLRILNSSGYYDDVDFVSLEPSLYDGVTQTTPVVASIVGGSLYLKPTPSSAVSLPLDYWAKFTPLSDSNASNWILTNNPDAYLFGTLIQSAGILGEDTRLPTWRDGFAAAIEQINTNAITDQFANMKLRADPALTVPRSYNIYTGRVQ